MHESLVFSTANQSTKKKKHDDDRFLRPPLHKTTICGTDLLLIMLFGDNDLHNILCFFPSFLPSIQVLSWCLVTSSINTRFTHDNKKPSRLSKHETLGALNMVRNVSGHIHICFIASFIILYRAKCVSVVPFKLVGFGSAFKCFYLLPGALEFSGTGTFPFFPPFR